MTMNKTAALILLNFRSLPVIARVFMLFFLIFAIMAFSFEAENKASSSILPGLMLVIVSTLALGADEKNRIETLHSTMPLTRGDIVKARYLYLVCILAVVMLPPLLLKPLFFQNDETIYFMIAGMFLAASFSAAVFYPLYFRYGYGTSGNIITLSVLIIFFVLLAFGALMRFRDLFALLVPAAATGKATAGLILIYLSYLLSLKIYRTRDL